MADSLTRVSEGKAVGRRRVKATVSVLPPQIEAINPDSPAAREAITKLLTTWSRWIREEDPEEYEGKYWDNYMVSGWMPDFQMAVVGECLRRHLLYQVTEEEYDSHSSDIYISYPTPGWEMIPIRRNLDATKAYLRGEDYPMEVLRDKPFQKPVKAAALMVVPPVMREAAEADEPDEPVISPKADLLVQQPHADVYPPYRTPWPVIAMRIGCALLAAYMIIVFYIDHFYTTP